MFVVGLDLSLRSSGCAIFNMQEQIWFLFSFAANPTQVGAYKVSENVFVTIAPKVPLPKDATPIERYIHVQQHLVAELCTRIAPEHRGANTYVVIEDYCAKSNQRRSGIRQHETGGNIKCAMHQAGFTNLNLVLNNTWKAGTVQKGNATKIDTVHFITETGPQVDLLKLFCLDEASLKRVKGVVQVPTPIQDLADASAICLYAFYVQTDSVRKPKRKPKVIVAQCPEVEAELRRRLELKKRLKRDAALLPWINTETKQKKRRVNQKKVQCQAQTQTRVESVCCLAQDA